MVKERRQDLDAVLAALAHPIRRAMPERLAQGDGTVGELAAPYDVSPPAIAKHLRVLEAAGLLEQTPEGRVRHCTLEAAPPSAGSSWVVRYRLFWEDTFTHIAKKLEGARTR
jgi:DNA-binding transcriptional ArsR family regulator